MQSYRATALQNIYRRGDITSEALRKAVSDGVITQEEFDKIIENVNGNQQSIN